MPRFLKDYRLTLAAILIVVAIIVGFFRIEQIVRAQAREERTRVEQDCIGRVEGRDALRNVFFFLISLAPKPDSVAVEAIRQYIDVKLPAITCDGNPTGLPTPVGP